MKIACIIECSQNISRCFHFSEFPNLVKHPGEDHLAIKKEVLVIIVMAIILFLDGITRPTGRSTLGVNRFMQYGEDGIAVKTESRLHAF